ncbi:hypothetical protein FS749_003758 [Ceratobasidium sp. UAMH 11750]|nr:hypothetical protein FS749_003758 [Ceratobasidium sp. UAMH 11750]
MQRPLATGEYATGGVGYKWVLGVNVWKDSTSPNINNLLASASIVVTLPHRHVHDLITHLEHFSQTIGGTKKVGSRLLSFGTLQLTGNPVGIEVWNVDAATIRGASKDTPLLVVDSRVSRLLNLRSVNGIVSCNVTLVQTEGGPPVQANLRSSAGVVDAVVDLKYSLFATTSPQFDVTAYSRFSQTTLWMTDQQGRGTLGSEPSTGRVIYLAGLLNCQIEEKVLHEEMYDGLGRGEKTRDAFTLR